MLVARNVRHLFPVDQQPDEKITPEIRRALHDQPRGLAAWRRRRSGSRPRFSARHYRKKNCQPEKNPHHRVLFFANSPPVKPRRSPSSNAPGSELLAPCSLPLGSRLAAKRACAS